MLHNYRMTSASCGLVMKHYDLKVGHWEKILSKSRGGDLGKCELTVGQKQLSAPVGARVREAQR